MNLQAKIYEGRSTFRKQAGIKGFEIALERCAVDETVYSDCMGPLSETFDENTLTVNKENECPSLCAVIRPRNVAFALKAEFFVLKSELIQLPPDRFRVDLTKDIERCGGCRGGKIRRARANLFEQISIDP